MENKLRIGFSLGDINGVGPEVLIKTLSDHRILQLFTPIIYGSNRVLSYYKKAINADHFKYSSCSNATEANPKMINVINVITDDIDITPGIENETGAKYALESLEAATNDLTEGKIDALVTGPINKHNMHQVGFGFNGHTEYFNYKAGDKGNLMILMDEHLKVALATHHIPLQDVPIVLSTDYIYNKIKLLANSLEKDFAIKKPVIAVLGLNPHAGDKGLLGKEESEMILPAIEKAQADKMLVVGPFPADGFFGNALFKKYDAVLSMYHDQGLVGFKALSFNSGTNYTAGLPFIRTSPDHGTAYDIAGKGIADHGSMLQAIYSALDIINNRLQYEADRANPMKPSKSERSSGKIASIS